MHRQAIRLGGLARSCSALLVVLCAVACQSTVVEPKLPPAWSSEAAAKPLARADCIDLALHSAANRAAWNARLEAARANFEQAKLLPNPTLSLSWEDFGLNSAAMGSPVQTTLSLAVALEDLLTRKQRTKVAEHELLAMEARLRIERAQVAADVARLYDRLVAARAALELSRDAARIMQVQRQAIEKLVTAGIEAPIEQRRAEAEYVQAQNGVLASDAQARALELEFAFALGFERPVALELSEGLSGTDASPAAGPAGIEDLLAKAIENRPELKAASEEYAALLGELHLRAARVQFLPTISAGPRKQGNELRAVAGIDSVLPIFDSGAVGEQHAQAELLAAAAEVRRAAALVAGEVCAAAQRRESAAGMLEHGARELSLRRRRLREDSQRLFEAGESDYSAFVLARRDEVEARRAELDAELTLALASIDLDAALGHFSD